MKLDINKEILKDFPSLKLDKDPLVNLNIILTHNNDWVRSRGVFIRDKLNIQKLIDNV